MENTSIRDQLTILVCSCDGYADLWEPFFKLLQRYWPDHECRIALNTETKAFSAGAFCVDALHPGSPDAPYGKRMREALMQIQTPYTLLLLDDFFFRKPVDSKKINDIVRWMDRETDIACVSFEWHTEITDAEGQVDGFFRMPQCAMYKLNMQAGIWRTDRLLHYWQDDDDPWRWELFVNYLTFDEADTFYTAGSREALPLDYGFDAEGWGVIRGKWVRKNLEPLFIENGIEIDYAKRGEYVAGAGQVLVPVNLETARYLLKRIGLKTTLGLTGFTVVKKIKRKLGIPLRYEFYPELLQARRQRKNRR